MRTVVVTLVLVHRMRLPSTRPAAAADERHLRPVDHPVRMASLDVGDDLAVQVHLVQMPQGAVQTVQLRPLFQLPHAVTRQGVADIQ